jgi:error-prone DNA polymerase
MSDYVELHASSVYSFLRGGAFPDELVARALELGLPGMAVLDRDGVYGAPQVYAEVKDQGGGLKPHVGAEITLEDGSALPLLATNQTGYKNLCRLISTAKLTPRRRDLPRDDLPPQLDPRERKRPCFASWAEVSAHAEGLVALTGDEDGPVLRAWERGGAGAVARTLAPLEKIFGPDRLFVELQRHRVRGEETKVQMLAAVAASRGLPLLVTGGVLHAGREDRLVTDVFCCLRNHVTLDQAGRLLAPNAERHLRPAKAMAELFHDYPEAVANTRRLSERLDFTLRNLGYEFPDYRETDGKPMEVFLRDRVYEGARERYRNLGELPPRHVAQIEKELRIIHDLQFDGYFLIVWDICRWTRKQKILIQGRGSAANSVVCYALGITAVDPLAPDHELLFERFLSEGRKGKDGERAWPDIDLDLPSGDLREKVIQEVYSRYKDRGAAMVANVITYRGRGSTREVGKVLGLPDDVLDRFSALYANGDFPETLDFTKQLDMSGLPKAHPRLRAMVALCHRIKGMPRHLGQHSGGMVLCPGRLDEVVPIEPASMEGRTVVQWDKEDCENLGLVKTDFLGLGMMAVLQDCQELCTRSDRPFKLEDLNDCDDPKTYAMMHDADTIGVFQIESRAQMSTLPRIKPSSLYDCAIQVAIVRPGPITGGVAQPLLRRREGKEKVVCIDPEIHERIKHILNRTCGVVLFQEQILQLAMELAEFSGGEAEELRRSLGFERSNKRLIRILAKLEHDLAARGGLKPHLVEKVMAATKSFAAYGFPESHAISFGLLAYASTWLKVHRIAEFYASLLNNQPMGFYSAATLVQDGRRHQLKVRPVCVQASEWRCTVEADEVMRIGLLYVKGLRQATVQAMLVERARAPFASLDDFLRRTDFTAAERRALAATGALNALAGHRRAALWQVEAAWSAEESLFRTTTGLMVEEDAPPLTPMTRSERFAADFDHLGLTAGIHPMALVRDQLPDVYRAIDLTLARDGDRIAIAGSVICRQRPGTAKGVVFVSLEDETGVANAIVSAEFFEKVRLVLNEESSLRIYGRVQNRAGIIHVKADRIEPLRLGEIPAQASHDFH